MNILLISRNSPFESIGGIERYIDNLLNYFKTNNNINLFVMLPFNGVNNVKIQNGVTILFSNSLYIPRNTTALKKDILFKSQNFSLEIKEIIDDKNINIICAENFHTDLPVAYSLVLNMISMSYHIPLILQLHSFAVTELQTELLNQLKWDKISCVSKSVAGDCFQKGIDIDILTTHYLGVNTNEFKINNIKSDLKNNLNIEEDSKLILTATRIIRGKRNIIQEKGLINLIEAFSKISSRYPKLFLLIAIGRPPEDLKVEFNIAYEILQGYLKLHNVKERTILKMYDLNEMPSVYQGSDIFTLPSENETFGQVFLEAMSCGVPVIGTKVGGIPEIISDSYNGFLVPPNDASILAQKIEILLKNEEIRAKFIKAGTKTIQEKFTSTLQITNFLEMLKNVYKNCKNN